MTDPRNLSPDQRELLDKLEKIALLPRPLVEADFEDASNDALDLLDARGLEFRDDDGVNIDTLARKVRGRPPQRRIPARLRRCAADDQGVAGRHAGASSRGRRQQLGCGDGDRDRHAPGRVFGDARNRQRTT